MAVKFGSYYGDGVYVPEADLTGDMKINIKDVAYVASWFGKYYTP